MAFASFEYFVFLFLSVVIYYLLPANRKKLYLLLISMLFIGLMSQTALAVVVFVTALNFMLAKIANRSLSLTLSLVINISFLILLKSIVSLFSAVDTSSSSLLFSFLMPVGLSYYVFQMIGYQFNINRNAIQPQTFPDLLLLNSFFPKFISGPVEDAGNFISKLYESRKITYESLRIAVLMIVIGLFKKLVIADRIAQVVDVIHANPMNYEGPILIIAAVLYVFQIYADFSGYTDIALGSAALFGFNLTQNFTNPLMSETVSEFWRRWHISLSDWINKYIYTPISLLVSMRWYIGKYGIALSLFITFFIVGLWHGFHINYMIFGALQGIALSYEILTKKFRKNLKSKFPARLYALLSMIITFVFISVSMVFLRAESFTSAIHFFTDSFLNFSSGMRDILWTFKSLLKEQDGVSANFKMFLSKTIVQKEFFLLRDFILSLIFVFLLLFADFHAASKKHISESIAAQSIILRWSIYAILVISIIILGVYDNAAFIYAKF